MKLVFYFLFFILWCISSSNLVCMKQQKTKKYNQPSPSNPNVDLEAQQRLTNMIMRLMNENKRVELFYHDKSEGKNINTL